MNKLGLILILICSIITFYSCNTKQSSEKTPKQEIIQSADQTKIQSETTSYSKKIEKGVWGNTPDFILPQLDGSLLKLSDYLGKVIILDFWATWCPPCRAEIPDFINLYNEYREKGLLIIGISLDSSGIETVKKFVNKMGINYPIVMGNNKVINDFGGITGIPTTFIIDRKGNQIQKFVGYRSKEVFESEIKKLL
jgi:peroxiredoxin